MSNPLFSREVDDGIILKIAVKPNSKKQELILDNNVDFITISLKSQPDKGKANKELTKFLADILGTTSSNIQIIKGQTSRDKQVLIRDLAIEEIKERIMKEKN